SGAGGSIPRGSGGSGSAPTRRIVRTVRASDGAKFSIVRTIPDLIHETFIAMYDRPLTIHQTLTQLKEQPETIATLTEGLPQARFAARPSRAPADHASGTYWSTADGSPITSRPT